MTSASSDRRLPLARLGLLTAAGLTIHGYHLGVEDGEIFIPAAKKLLDPQLYPYAPEFFLSHQHLSLFSAILAWTARLTHLSMDATVFLWYIAGLFGMLVSCWMLSSICFSSERARWCSVLIVTAVLTMPATNTGLLLIDPYVTPRSLSTPLTLIALVCFLGRHFIRTAIASLLTVAIHPQMAVCLIFLMGVIWLAEKSTPVVRERVPVLASAAGILPAGFHFSPAQEPYREALYARDFFFLANWTWYDWVGMLAPLAILAWFWKGKFRGTTHYFQSLSFALIPFGVLSILIAGIFSSSHDLDMFARLQPLRCFHLITVVFIVLLGGVIGEYASENRPWILPAIVLPLAAGMFFVARETYPFSPQIELPWLRTSPNSWMNALLWIRENTPKDAVFAVDSRYFKDKGVDVHGFRTISERSALADYFKDGGVVAMFPELAVEWKQMSSSTSGLNHFHTEDFTRLANRFPVSWTLVHGPAPDGMECPYQQAGYTVCRIPRVKAIPSRNLFSSLVGRASGPRPASWPAHRHAPILYYAKITNPTDTCVEPARGSTASRSHESRD